MVLDPSESGLKSNPQSFYFRVLEFAMPTRPYQSLRMIGDGDLPSSSFFAPIPSTGTVTVINGRIVSLGSNVFA